MELDLFCQLFYASHYIPMALLQKGEIQKSYASIERPLPLYGKILEQGGSPGRAKSSPQKTWAFMDW